MRESASILRRNKLYNGVRRNKSIQVHSCSVLNSYVITIIISSILILSEILQSLVPRLLKWILGILELIVVVIIGVLGRRRLRC